MRAGPNDTDTLHDPQEPQFGGLMSLMDALGGTIVCDECKRWQRLGTLLESDAENIARQKGWTRHDGKDLCPLCRPQAL